MKWRCSDAMRWRVASSSSDTWAVMTLEWNCSRLVMKVSSTAIPMEPPRLRIMLNMAEAEPAFSRSMPLVVSEDKGVSTTDCPSARTRFGTKN